VAAEATQPAVLPADFRMRPSLKALRSSASDRAHRAAEGAAPPAGQDPLPLADAATPGAVERGTIRRRLRRARRLRETLLTELGALVMEMHRQKRHDRALLERKAMEALVADREALGLARALGEGYGVTQVVAAGISGACYVCGSLLGTDDRYCSRCGTAAVGARNGAARSSVPADTVAAPPPDAGARAEGPPPPPDPGARVETPSPALAGSPPPHPGALAGGAPAPPPPDPGARIPAPGVPAPGQPVPAKVLPDVPPPPDPTTRVLPSTGDPSAPIGTRRP
jgi:hypothetical protein